MEQFFIRLSNVRQLPRALAGCVLVLALPSLGIGFQADDFVIAQRVRDHPLDAFSFIPGGLSTSQWGDRGLLSWFASPALKLHLLRPLSSLSHALDFALWPDAAWWMHLENMLLYAAMVWVVTLIYAELLSSQHCARIAAVFFAFGAAHATSIGWISSRNTLLSALFGLLSVLLFVRAKAGCTLTSVGVHALALSAGEAATAVLAPLLAYTWLFDVGTRRLRVLPHIVLCASYLLIYQMFGFGAAHGGMYLNPIQQPWTVAENLVIAVPLYLHSSLVLPMAGLAGLLPRGLWLLVALTCVSLLALLPWVFPVLRSDRRAQFFALSALASILPLSAVTPQDRLGFFVDFGAYGLLAVCLSAHDSAPYRRGIPRMLFWLHTSGAVLAFIPLCFVCCVPAVGGGPRALNHALIDVDDRDVVVLNVALETAIASVSAMRQKQQIGQPRSMRALYVGTAAYGVRRVDDRTLDLHVADGWFRNALERIARDPRDEPFAVGDQEVTETFSARVLEVDARGTPKRVRFQFIRPLDDPHWLWLRSEGARVLRWQPPPAGGRDEQQLGAVGALL
ncbi:MAG: hypothetical protein ABW321_27270 [Polyangiales bacterium]